MIILSMLILVCSGCSLNSNTYDYNVKANDYYDTGSLLDHISPPEGQNSLSVSGNREESSYNSFTEETIEGVEGNKESKITTTVNIAMETVEFDKSIDLLDKTIKDYNGVISQSDIYSNGGQYGSRTNRIANYTIKIPKDDLELFLSTTGTVGEVTSKNTKKDDMSEYYYDTESRLTVLKVKESRVLDLLTKAAKIEDMITLENTLSDIIYEKDNLTGTLKGIDNRVSYSTVIINIREVERIERQETITTSFGEKISNAFSRSMANVSKSVQAFIISMIYFLPIIILIVLGTTFIVLASSKLRKKLAKRKLRRSKDTSNFENNIDK